MSLLSLDLPPITNPNVPTAKYGTTPEAGLEKLITLGIGTVTIGGAILLLVYFAYGALLIIFSGGDTKGQEKGKGIITNAAVGLIILILVTTLAAIVGRILGIKILEPEWTKIFV